MEWLQTLLESSTTPPLTAFLLGLLTALSPCPLATNIAAIGFIGREIDDRRRIFRNGLLYTLGRTLSYTLLSIVLILILKEGSSMFGIQKAIGKWGEWVLGPLLIVIGAFMLAGDRLRLPSFGFRRGGWGALLLGVLIPMSASAEAGYLLPVLFAVATALPVLVVAWILAFGARRIGQFYGRMQTIQKWLNRIFGGLFVMIGIYYCAIMYF